MRLSPRRSMRDLTLAAAATALAIGAFAPAAQAGVTVFASVTITKVTDPAADPQDFTFTNNFQVSSPTVNVIDTDPDSGTPSSYTFGVGAEDEGFLIVSEEDLSSWTLTDIQCTGDADVSYNVDGNNVSLQPDLGESISCTFYNTKFAQLTLDKDTVPGTDPQDFTFALTGPGVPASWDLDTDPGSMFTGDNITWPMTPDDLGEYTITEAEVAGWTLTDIDCTGNTDSDRLTSLVDRVVEIGVDAGELIQCTFTNVKDGFGTAEPSMEASNEPSDAPSDGPSDAPSQDASPELTDDEGAATDVPTVPGTDTLGEQVVSTSSGLLLLLVALGLLSAVLVVTMPKRR